MMENNVLVSIHCLAYNHEPYIRQCLEGFVMQKTTFKFEILIHDDASTDHTANIIYEYEKKYPDLLKPIYQTKNQYSQHIDVGRLNLSRAKGKYIAWCEGDDYWTDPLKLQKQVDFLEGHSEYGLCYTKVRYFHQATKRFIKTWGGPYTCFDDLFERNTVPTLTVLLRRNLYNQYIAEIQPEQQHWRMGDYPMWLWFAHESSIKFMPEVTGVYRILTNSASHSNEFERNLCFVRSGLDIKRYYNTIFKLGISEQIFEYREWCLLLRTYAIYMKFWSFLSTFRKGIAVHPSFLFRIESYKYLLFFISKKLRDKRR